MNKYTLSAAIVNYRTPDMVIKCVNSIIGNNICAPEDIVILDNMSGDGSFETLKASFPQCVVIQSPKNRGYGDGMNIAVKNAPTEYVLCLNPDTYFENNKVLESVKILNEQKDIGILGLDLHYPNGQRQYSARTNYAYLDILLRRSKLGSLPIARRRVDAHLMKSSWKHGIFDADWVIGTGFVVRKSAFDAVEGMDTTFFMYMEDIDLCLRVRRAGWRVVAVPGMELVHEHQRASADGLLSKAAKRHLHALNVFRKKHTIKWM